MPVQAMRIPTQVVKILPPPFPHFALHGKYRRVRGLTAVSDMSHIRSVPSIEAGNAALQAIGLVMREFTRRSSAPEGIAYGLPG